MARFLYFKKENGTENELYSDNIGKKESMHDPFGKRMDQKPKTYFGGLYIDFFIYDNMHVLKLQTCSCDNLCTNPSATPI